MNLPSGSKLDRAMACIASTVLPKVDSLSEAADAGRVKHAFLAAVLAGDKSALASVPEEYRQACDELDPDLPRELFPGAAMLYPEAVFLYDVRTETTRFAGSNVPVPERTPTEVVVVADLAGVVAGTAVVLDFKTGRKAPRASTSWQLKAGAVAACQHFGATEARVGIVHFPPGGSPRVDLHDMDALSLVEARVELAAMATRARHAETALATGSVKATTGPQCDFCPSKTYCPAYARVISAMAGDPIQAASAIAAAITPETAARAYEKLKLAKDALRHAESILYGYAADNPIELPDGRVFGPVTVTRRELDGSIVRGVLEKLHGREVADAACSYDSSKAAVERALRPVVEAQKALGGKITLRGTTDEAMAAIEEAGGVLVKERTEMKEQ